MSDSNNEFVDAFFDSMEEAGALPPAHLRAAAQPSPPRPRSDDAERRLRTTAETLPYGTTYVWADGHRSVLERVEGPTVELTPVATPFGLPDSGHVALGDPVDMSRRRVKAVLEPGPHRTQLAVLDDGRRRRGAVAVLGDPDSVVSWSPDNDSSGKLARLRTGSGLGCLFDARSLRAVKAVLASTDDLASRVRAAGLVPLEHAGRVVGVAFDCGAGPGEYVELLGFGAGGRRVAVAVDLGLHHEAAEALPPA